MGSLDPPRAGVREAVRECHGAGVRVAMITGDQLPTACAIAKDIGILTETEDASKRSVTCAVLHEDDDPSLPYKPSEEIDQLVDGWEEISSCHVAAVYFFIFIYCSNNKVHVWYANGNQSGSYLHSVICPLLDAKSLRWFSESAHNK